MEQQNHWLSIYLIYNEPWEKLLTECLNPFAKSIIEKSLAERFFFIRYWEKGPHIRLRFEGKAEDLEKIKSLAAKVFCDYFIKYPSFREEPAWLKSLPEEQQWFPDNSVRYVPYEPETQRYGGPVGLHIAEKQFQSSSSAVLSLIEDSQDWDYTSALGAAIQLHLSFAYAMGMDLDETLRFFTCTFEGWLPRAYYFFEKDITAEELADRREKTLEAFKSTFEKQKESLVPFHESFWQALLENNEFEQEWLNKWIREMKARSNELKTAQQENTLICPETFGERYPADIPAATRERWILYDSYIHMTNNRLGITNRDEGYLGYIINESLKHLKKSMV
ncbi:MAG: putative Lantibiotic biosynthesis protein [Bacteroidetes bacterium]|nr:putative Lantibiotic biosynthesis protein [Bacteroidota bacterium]